MSKRIIVFLAMLLALLPGCYNSLFSGPSTLENPRYTRVISYSGTSRIIPVVIDKNFSHDDKVSIDNAINAWNYVLNGYVFMKAESYNFDMEVDVLKSIIKRRGLIILKVDHDSFLIPDGASVQIYAASGKTLAWANDIGGNKIWVVRDRFYPPDTFPIMLHELGHILGAEHEKNIPENKEFLMYPYYERNKWRCIDGRAMEKVAYYQFIIPERLNYCY